MKLFLIILIALFSWTTVVASPVTATVYSQKRDGERGKKDPPGPPVVKDKQKDSKPKEPPKRGKKPD
jgi:hypothetical protein